MRSRYSLISLISSISASAGSLPLKSSAALEKAIASVRQVVKRLTGDRALTAEVEKVAALVRSGTFAA